MNKLFAFLSGSLFGLGLMISGMTDTEKVQGWLDLLGDWDITLAFVMFGAMIPMFIAWKFTKKVQPINGGSFPDLPSKKLDKNLIIGSILFGMGWGLSGLCPGPTLAALTFGGDSLLVFIISMIAGMLFAPNLRRVFEFLQEKYS
jgi:uncharacterized membrane protein YedE/YeeE